MQRVWEDHLGANEGGRRCTQEELLAAHQTSLKAAPSHAHVPTLVEWEGTFRKLKSRKAPGWDGPSTDHLQLALPQLSLLTYPLALKAASTGSEPLRWRGGQAIPLYKGKGDPTKPTSHRSILVSEVLGKRYHCWIRQLSWRPSAPPCRHGRRSVYRHAFLDVALFQSHMQEKRASYGILFLDLRAAFDTEVRMFLTGVRVAEDFTDWTRQQGLDPEVADLVRDASQCHTAAAFPWGQFQARLSNLLDATWFHVPGSGGVRCHLDGNETARPPCRPPFCLGFCTRPFCLSSNRLGLWGMQPPSTLEASWARILGRATALWLGLGTTTWRSACRPHCRCCPCYSYPGLWHCHSGLHG